MKHWIIDFLIATGIIGSIMSLGFGLMYGISVLVLSHPYAGVVLLAASTIIYGAIVTHKIRKEF